ncbi:MAG: GTPase ObgE [Bdellovibrio sp.]|nr:GTPase ObgE [Bdellovibrio sp.]
MRFIDEAKIKLTAGNGGPGAVSFRREKYIPKGGPDGGSGGKGGDIIFRSTHQQSTLQDFRYKRIYQAQNGKQGSGGNKSGKDGLDIIILIPVGTVIKDAISAISNNTLMDFTQDKQTWIACHGGRGGKGNSHFATSTFQTPRFAQPGEAGEHKELHLELKLLADVGLVGFPNTGKSTFISKVSRARPKIADYPFTTLTPSLGVVSLGEFHSFVLADIPGLIKGASKGQGLGHKFLKHIERTRFIIHLLDGTEILDKTPEEAIQILQKKYQIIRKELKSYHPGILEKKEIVAINKIDLFEKDQDFLTEIKKGFHTKLKRIKKKQTHPEEPWLVSALSGDGLTDLLKTVSVYLRD